MPYITEEIWDKIKDDKDDLIILSDWPERDERFNFKTESEEAGLFKDIVYKIRNIRGEMNIPPDKKANVVFKTGKKNITSLIEREKKNIKALAKVDDILIDGAYEPLNTDASAVLTDIEIYIPLKGLIDVDKEKSRLEKEINKIKFELEKVNKKLTNKEFLGKAPDNIINKEKNKKSEYEEIISKLDESLSKLA